MRPAWTSHKCGGRKERPGIGAGAVSTELSGDTRVSEVRPSCVGLDQFLLDQIIFSQRIL